MLKGAQIKSRWRSKRIRIFSPNDADDIVLIPLQPTTSIGLANYHTTDGKQT